MNEKIPQSKTKNKFMDKLKKYGITLGIAAALTFPVKKATAQQTTTTTTTKTEQVDNTNTHEYLLKTKQTYKKNYDRATYLFDNDAGINCANISANRKLTTNEQTAELMTVYFSFTRKPQNWTVQDKKVFLGLYYYDFKTYEQMQKGQIVINFDKLIKEMKKEDLSGVAVPMVEIKKDDVVNADAYNDI